MDEQRREREGKEADREADRARARATETAEPAGRRDRASDSSSGTAKMMSASPVGNFYIYSFDGKLLQVYDVYGHLLKDYIYMGDRLIAEYDHVGSRYLYYTPDQINTTRVVTDGVGNVVYSAVHDPYGGIQQTLVSTYDPQLKFSGKERDAESQLDYFGARYYDRSQYRFISVDPVIDTSGGFINAQLWDLYSYCRNNPVSYIDPDGAQSISIIIYYTIVDKKSALKNTLNPGNSTFEKEPWTLTSDKDGNYTLTCGAQLNICEPGHISYREIGGRTTPELVLFEELGHLGFGLRWLMHSLESIVESLKSGDITEANAGELAKKAALRGSWWSRALIDKLGIQFWALDSFTAWIFNTGTISAFYSPDITVKFVERK